MVGAKTLDLVFRTVADYVDDLMADFRAMVRTRAAVALAGMGPSAHETVRFRT